jgi:antitoxin VapB
MASLYIKDPETAALVARVAERSGMTKTALIRELVTAREAELERSAQTMSPRERLEKFWREHPLGEPTGLVADKAFYDSLNDEDDD